MILQEAFDIWLILHTVQFFVWKNNSWLKEQFTRLKTKQNVQLKVVELTAKELFLLWIWLEKAV